MIVSDLCSIEWVLKIESFLVTPITTPFSANKAKTLGKPKCIIGKAGLLV